MAARAEGSSVNSIDRMTCDMKTVIGSPNCEHMSTSFVERRNLPMRMPMRRFTRLISGFSKKIESQGHAAALHFVYYNFCRVPKTLRVTPRRKQGLRITSGLWRS